MSDCSSEEVMNMIGENLSQKRDKSLFRDIVGHELFILDFTIYFILFRRTPANVEIIGII